MQWSTGISQDLSDIKWKISVNIGVEEDGEIQREKWNNRGYETQDSENKLLGFYHDLKIITLFTKKAAYQGWATLRRKFACKAPSQTVKFIDVGRQNQIPVKGFMITVTHYE